MTLFDSHCHLTDPAFARETDAVVERAREAGIAGLVTVASDLADAPEAAALAARHDGVWCTAGIHPHVAAKAPEDARSRLRELLGGPRAVAVGETGLDYHHDNSPRVTQRAVFEMQLGLAADLGMPVVVHSRDADADTAAMIRAAAGRVPGVLHCFSGGQLLLDAGLEAGWFVSFAGMITFRNYAAVDLLRAVPDDRLLLETDSPYLAPVPRRGKRNEPAFLRHTCETAAALRGIDAGALSAITTRNARRFYRLEEQADATRRDFAGPPA
jgi:TatD DNase family protein